MVGGLATSRWRSQPSPPRSWSSVVSGTYQPLITGLLQPEIRKDGTFGLKLYRNETMTGARYHSLLQYHVLPELRQQNGGNLARLVWQQVLYKCPLCLFVSRVKPVTAASR